MTTADHGKDTRQRVLESACSVFAERGFRDATVAAICKRAGANIASVNYYFGDKETLYAEAWRHAFAAFLATSPEPEIPEPLADSAAALRALIQLRLRRVFATGLGGCFSRMMIREMAEPTNALAHMVEESIRPQYERMARVIQAMLGGDAPEQAVRFCTMSVMGQIIFFAFNKPVRTHMMGRASFDAEEQAALAEHIIRFSLNGIEATKASLQEMTA